MVTLLLPFSAWSQLDSISGVVDFSTDGFGNIFIAKKNSEFIKVSPTGKSIRVNSRKDFGAPTSINADNALRIILFFQEQGWLIVADNQLAFQAEIDLKQLGFTDPTLVTNSFDGGIWIFDRSNGTLNKMILSSTGPSLGGSIDLRQILYTTLNPEQLVSDGNHLVLCNGKNLYLMDRYATFIRKIELDETAIQVTINGNELNAYSENDEYSCDIRYLTPPLKTTHQGVGKLKRSSIEKSQKIELSIDGILRISPSIK